MGRMKCALLRSNMVIFYSASVLLPTPDTLLPCSQWKVKPIMFEVQKTNLIFPYLFSIFFPVFFPVFLSFFPFFPRVNLKQGKKISWGKFNGKNEIFQGKFKARKKISWGKFNGRNSFFLGKFKARKKKFPGVNLIGEIHFLG